MPCSRSLRRDRQRGCAARASPRSHHSSPRPILQESPRPRMTTPRHTRASPAPHLTAAGSRRSNPASCKRLSPACNRAGPGGWRRSAPHRGSAPHQRCWPHSGLLGAAPASQQVRDLNTAAGTGSGGNPNLPPPPSRNLPTRRAKPWNLQPLPNDPGPPLTRASSLPGPRHASTSVDHRLQTGQAQDCPCSMHQGHSRKHTNPCPA